MALNLAWGNVPSPGPGSPPAGGAGPHAKSLLCGAALGSGLGLRVCAPVLSPLGPLFPPDNHLRPSPKGQGLGQYQPRKAPGK